MTQQRISSTLVQEGRTLCCAACGHNLGAAGEPWKQNARLCARPVASLPGSGSAVNRDLLIRSFACPGCATLLDSEVALPEDPYLQDVVLA